MTTSEIIKNTVQPILVWILVLTAVNAAITGTSLYLMSSRHQPEVNLNLQIPVSPPDQDVAEIPGQEGSAYVNGRKMW